MGFGLGVALVITGVLSAYLPFLGCCNCLWPIGAGMLAVSLYVKKSPVPASIGDGAMIGAIASLIGGLIYLIIGVPVAYFLNANAMAQQFEQLRAQGINIPDVGGFVFVFLAGIFGVVIYAILGVIGGLIGVPVFEKRKGGPGAPPPPPGFGGPQGGSYQQPGGYNQPGGYGTGM